VQKPKTEIAAKENKAEVAKEKEVPVKRLRRHYQNRNLIKNGFLLSIKKK